MREITNLALKKKIPLTIIFELTYHCNLRCLHCYVVRKKKRELSFEEIRRVLREIKSAGTLILTLSGGEILTRPDFWEIASYASSLKLALNLYTNGVLITSALIPRLKKLLVYQVHLSLYSHQAKTHDQITRVEGSFRQTLSAIKLLQRNRIKVKIKTPLMKQNIRDFPQLIALAKKLKVSFLLDPTLTPCQNGERTPTKWRITEEDLYFLYTHPALKPHLGTEVNYHPDKDYLCSAGHNFCSISPYGDIYPCLQLPLLAGNLRKQPFSEIWTSSPVLKKIRSLTTSELPKCRQCRYLYLCSRCLGLAYLEEGDLLAPSQRACQIAKVRWKIKREKNGNKPRSNQSAFSQTTGSRQSS